MSNRVISGTSGIIRRGQVLSGTLGYTLKRSTSGFDGRCMAEHGVDGRCRTLWSSVDS